MVIFNSYVKLQEGNGGDHSIDGVITDLPSGYD